MTFHNLTLLPGLAGLLALPLLIHLFSRAFPKVFEFSTLQYLRASVAGSSQLWRLRHWVLVALRTLFVGALLLAFLRPIVPRFGAAPAAVGRRVLLVIDQSLSMEYQGAGITGRQRAKTEAAKVVAALGADDVLNALVVGATPRLLQVEFSQRHAQVAALVEELGPGLGQADFSAANRLVARLVNQSEAPTEIYYLSDFQRRSWANVDFRALPPRARVFFVDAGGGRRGNRAVLGAAINQTRVLAGETPTLEIEVGNFRDEHFNEAVKVVLDGRRSFQTTLSIAPWSVGKVSVPLPVGDAGLRLCEVSLEPDDLPQDDRFYLTIPVLEKEPVLIVSDDKVGQRPEVQLLSAALNPYEHQAGSLLPERIAAGQLTAARLATVRKVFFAHSGRLSGDSAKALAEFIARGGGVLYFLDGDDDGQNMALLEQALGGERLPLTIGGKRVAGNLANGSQRIGRGDFRSRYLRLFRGSQRQNLELLEFYDVADVSPTGAGQVLLHYADETPALASLSHGLGSLLLANFSVSELAGNIARQRLFPAWIQDLVKNLSDQEPAAAAVRIGALVEAEMWRSEWNAGPLLKPSGQALVPSSEVAGERVSIAFLAEELGFYIQRGRGTLHAYGVNAPVEESDLRPVDRELLDEALAANGQRGYFVAGTADYHEVAAGRSISQWFVVGALGLLLAEMAWLWGVKAGGARGAKPGRRADAGAGGLGATVVERADAQRGGL